MTTGLTVPMFPKGIITCSKHDRLNSQRVRKRSIKVCHSIPIHLNDDLDVLELYKFYLVVAPSLLTRWCSEGQGTVAAERHASCGQVQCSRNGAGRCREVTSEHLLQLLIRIGRENLLEERLKSSFRYCFRRQVHLAPRSSRHRLPRFHCTFMRTAIISINGAKERRT